ncbi:MAG: HAMP domain-containing protein [Halobacteriovoraceae bacterium]|nr:HAMP domain-containing protein [Halobacteriovoraceae bacterium]
MKTKFKIPIIVKLSLLIILAMGSLGGYLAFYTSKKIQDNITSSSKYNQIVQTKLIADSISQVIESYISKTKEIAYALIQESAPPSIGSELIFIKVHSWDNGRYYHLAHPSKIDDQKVNELTSQGYSPSRFESKDYIINQVNWNGQSIFKIEYKIDPNHYATSYFGQERILKLLNSENLAHISVLSSEGNYLVKPLKEVNLEMIHQFQDNPLKSIQKDLGKYYASFVKTPFGVGILSIINKEKILSPIRFLNNEIFLTTGILSSILFFLVFLFSMGITEPIEKLKAMTERLAKGQFDIHASQSIKTRDEVEDLAHAFDHMAIGLKEREKYLSVLKKFHGTSITDEILGSEDLRSGKSGQATVLFTDLRGFTSLSESQDAKSTVKMLNDYFEIMVSIINKHGGVIDKFIGDAIMAVWGAPKQSEDDCLNAVNACLEMRKALEIFNAQRMALGLSPIYMGMGLHTGEVISGTVGSSDRLEYTIIGDTVNTASRVESSTKQHGVDLLISETTLKEVQNHIIAKSVARTTLKGKSNFVGLYEVLGTFKENGIPEYIQTPYSHLENYKKSA